MKATNERIKALKNYILDQLESFPQADDIESPLEFTQALSDILADANYKILKNENKTH